MEPDVDVLDVDTLHSTAVKRDAEIYLSSGSQMQSLKKLKAKSGALTPSATSVSSGTKDIKTD